MYDWTHFVRSGYPMVGEPLSTVWYLPHIQNGFPVEIHAILDYDERGFLRAGCMYFPQGGPTESPGAVTVIVRKNERRKGIATRLVAVMIDTFPEINPQTQIFSDDGWAFVTGSAEKFANDASGTP